MSFVDPAFAQMFGGARRPPRSMFGQMPFESGLPELPQLPSIESNIGGLPPMFQTPPMQAFRPPQQEEQKYDFELEDPEQQKNVLAGYGQTALGGLQKAGNLLGTPGDVVRNLIAGKGTASFAPLADPLSGENRTSGRDLLRMAGIAGPQDTWTNFLGGLAVDIVTDPLTPLTLMGGSLSKGGRIASKAGLTPEARFVLADRLGKEVGLVGPRQAQATVTLQELLPMASKRQQDIIDRELAKLTQTQRQAALESPLGPMASYNLPGMEPIRLGSDKLNQQIATGIDKAMRRMQFGEPLMALGIRGAPIDAFRRLVDKTINETRGPTAQAYAQRSYRQGQETDFAVRMARSNLITKLNEVGMLDRDKQDELGSLLESTSQLAMEPLPIQESITQLRDSGFADPTQIGNIPDLFRNKTVLAAQEPEVQQAVKRLKKMGVKSPAHFSVIQDLVQSKSLLDSYPPEVQQIVTEMRSELASSIAKTRRMGLPKETYKDPLSAYYPRYKGPEQTRMEMQTTPFGQNDPSQRKRLAAFRGIVDPRKTINDVTLDPEIRQLVESSAPVQDIENLIAQKYSDRIPPTYVTDEEYVRVREANKRISEKNVQRIAEGKDPIPLERPAESNRYREFAKIMDNASDELLDQGMFPNHPAADWLVYESIADRARNQTANAARMLTEPGVIGYEKSRGNTVKLTTVLAKMQLRLGDLDRETKLLGDVSESIFPTQERQRVAAINKQIREENKKLKAQGLPQKPLEVLQPQSNPIDISNSEGFGYEIARAMMDRGMDPTKFKPGEAYISKEMADNLTSFIRPFTQPETVSRIRDATDAILNVQKAYLTGTRPAFHVRNLMSATIKNVLRNQFSVQSVKDTATLLRGGIVKDAKSIPAVRDEWLKLNPGESLDKLDDTEATLILGRILEASGQGPRMGGELTNKVGQTMDPVAGSIEEILGSLPGRGNKMFSARELVMKAAGRTPDTSWNWRDLANVDKQAWIVAGKYLGGGVEAVARTSPMIKLLREGYDPVQAARKVASAQVDYSSKAYTKTELQVLARLFPFYKFSRGTIPEEFLELIRRPGGPQAQLIKGLASSSESDQLTPDYIAESVSIPLEGTPLAEGTPTDTDRYLTGFGFAFEDPLSFLSGGIRGGGGELLSRMNPLVKAPIEYISGETFFQRTPQGGRELSDTDPTIGRILANVTGQEKAVTYPGSQGIEFFAANSPISPFLTIARQLTDPRKSNPAVKALNLLTGVKITDVSPAVKDQLLRGIIEQQMVNRGAKQFLRTYYPTAELPGLSEQERQEILQLQSIANMLAKRTKERKAEKEAAKQKAEQEKKMGQFQNN